MLLQPCQGNQSIPVASTVELKNEGDDPCEIVSKKDGTVFRLEGNETLRIPAEQHMVSKGRIQFTVNKSGRSFTVYGVMKEEDGSQVSSIEGRRGSVGAAMDENKRGVENRRESSLADGRRKSAPSAPGSIQDLDPLTVSTENYINERLGNRESVPDMTTGEPRTPHAHLSELQLQAAKHSKMLAIKREIAPIMENVRERIQEGALKIRTEPSLYHDIGLRERLWEVLDQYNPLWLSEGLQAISQTRVGEEEFGEADPRRKAMRQQYFDEIFSNPQIIEEQKEKRQGAFPENTEFVMKMSRHIVCKFLELVLFLDRAKQSELLRAPMSCLFRPDADSKSSEGVLVQFGTIVFAGEGDITRHLKKLDYTVAHKQTPLEEYDTNIPRGELSVRIKDGIILAMLVRTFDPVINVLHQLRIPAKERLHYLMNNEKVLDAIASSDSSLLDTGRRGKITKYDIADGHKEKTLGFVWKMILKFGLSSLLEETVLMEEIKRVSYRNQGNEHWRNTIERLINEDENMEAPVEEDEDASQQRLQRLLLNWAQVVCAGYEAVPPVTDFSGALADGAGLCVLIHHYHPDLLPLESIHFTKTGQDTELPETDRLRRERKNFATLNAVSDALGQIPVRLMSCNTRNPPSSQLGFACVAFLCSRLLGTSSEIKAAKKIQTLWMKNRARKTKSAESEKKARKLMREMARIKMEEALASQDSQGLVRTLVFKSPRPSRLLRDGDDSFLSTNSILEDNTDQYNNVGGESKPITPASEARKQEKDKAAAALSELEELRRKKQAADTAERNRQRAVELEQERQAHLEAEKRVKEIKVLLDQSKATEARLREKMARLEVEKESAEKAAMRERREREEAEKRAHKEREQKEAFARDATEIRQRMEAEWVNERGNTAEQFANEQSKWLTLSRKNAELIRKLDETEQTLQKAYVESRIIEVEAEERRLAAERRLEDEERERIALQSRIEEEAERVALLQQEKASLELRVEALARKCEKLESALQQALSREESDRMAELEELSKQREIHALEEENLRREQERLEEERIRFEQEKQTLESSIREREEQMEQLLAEERRSIEVEVERQQRAIDELMQTQMQVEESRRKAVEELQAIEAARQAEEERIQSIQTKAKEIEDLNALEQKRLESIRNEIKLTSEKASAADRVVVHHNNQRIFAAPVSNQAASDVDDDADSWDEPMEEKQSEDRPRFVRFALQEEKKQHERHIFSKPRPLSGEALEVSRILNWLQNPEMFARLEDAVLRNANIRSLFFNRECIKGIIWALRRCERAENMELRCLLRSIFGCIQSQGGFPKSDLAIHLANALMDVLQIFYDMPEEFNIAIQIFSHIWVDFKDQLDYRLQSLIELLDTKRKIQRLCGVTNSTCDQNLRHINEALIEH